MFFFLFSFSFFSSFVSFSGRLLTVFVDCVPVSTLLRIWDCFLYEGAKIPFRIALAMLQLNQAQILKVA